MLLNPRHRVEAGLSVTGKHFANIRAKGVNMNIKRKILAVAIGVSLSAAAQAGNIFITGHDSDEHENGAYMNAGLDYLLFGTAQAAGSRGKTVAFIDTFNGAGVASALSGSYTVSTFSADAAGITSALTGGFDAVIVGSGSNSSANTALLAAAGSFTTYFNAGGSIYINTDEGFGQGWFGFVPSFGTTVANSISTSGIFTPTAAGLTIGLTNAIVDADITHNYFTGVNSSLFTIFEVTDQNTRGVPVGEAVALGLRDATISSGGFSSGTANVPEPATLGLMALGFAGLAAARRRQTS